MDLRDNLSPSGHFSPYTASSYPLTDGHYELAGTTAAGRRLLVKGDSLMAMGANSKIRVATNRAVDLKKVIVRWTVIRGVVFVVLGLSSIFFALFIVEPLLVFLFTLGTCVSGGCHEWLEFSNEVLWASLIPGGVSLLSALIVAVAHLRVVRATRQLSGVSANIRS